MLTNITTTDGSNKPTPQIVVTLLGAAIPLVWMLKDVLLEAMHVPTKYSSVAAVIVSYVLIHLANQLGVDLPGSSSTVTINQPKPGEAATATVETKNVSDATVSVTPAAADRPDTLPERRTAPDAEVPVK